MRLLVYGDIGGSGGYTQYCRGVFGSGVIPGDFEVYFVCSEDFYHKVKPLDGNIKVITHTWLSSKSFLKRYLWHLYIYPKIVRQIKPDIEFYPGGKLRVYLRKAITVALSANLLLFDEGELNRYKGTVAYKNLLGYRSSYVEYLKNSSAVIFMSDYSRKLIMNQLRKTVLSAVIPSGFNPDSDILGPRSYELSKIVNMLYVSTIMFYKHQSEVVRALKIVRDKSGLDVRLALIGQAARLELNLLKELIRSEGLEGYVDIRKEVKHEDLLQEYKRADLFIFASSCEAGSVTLVESMGAGLPIACSDRSGLSEQLKDAGTYFDPEKPSSIADALLSLISSKEKRQICGQKANKYSQEYTWKRGAEKTFDFIRSVYENRK
ncbi:MAG: glycosyltransferase [Candidatus Omnitrophica bacterium]|nr:glycosyltransferase [Candidatus Omnitrophota bacterium]